MKLKLLLGLFSTIFLMDACALPAPQSRIPLLVSHVQIKNIKGKLIRAIKYIPGEKLPYLEIERIKTPDLDKLIDRLSINKVNIQFHGKETVLDFENSQMASIEEIKFVDSNVIFKLFYVFTGTAAPSIMVSCKIDVTQEQLPEPECHQIPMED